MVEYREYFGYEEVQDIIFFQTILAEFLGSLFLVFFGVACDSLYGEISEVESALAYGMVTSCLVITFGFICGASFNPAVTLAFILVGDLKIIKGLFYIFCEIAGATLGATLIYAIKSKDDRWLGIVMLHNEISSSQGFLYEMLAAIIIALVYLAITDNKRPGLKSTAFIVAGAAVTASHFATYRYTKAGMNPARTFATAAVNSVVRARWNNFWLYLFGPLLGGVIAAAIYKLVLTPKYNREEKYEYEWC